MVRHGGHLWARHPAVRTGDELSAGERSADWLKRWFGTWTALFLVAAWIAAWMLWQKTPWRFDPAPYILLNLCLSCLAAVQGIILQISANRGDRISAEVALHTQGNTDTLVDVNHQQLAILNTLNGLDGKVADLAEAVNSVMAARAQRDQAPAVTEAVEALRTDLSLVLRAVLPPAEPQAGQAASPVPAAGGGTQGEGTAARRSPRKPKGTPP